MRAALAATGGVEDPTDVAKHLLAGADVVLTASALLRRGPEYAGTLLDGLSTWMARKGFASVGELRGMLSVPAGADETEYERTGYVSALRAANAAPRIMVSVSCGFGVRTGSRREPLARPD